ncbi:chemotaxis protein CheD [Liquorilactobacillus satsumensis]
MGISQPLKKAKTAMEPTQKEIKVSIADYKLASSPDKMLTVGLGSCVGTFIYDERVGIGGLSHIMLPDSKPFVGKGTINPAKFADLALPAMVAELKKGAPSSNLKAKIVGGANMFNFNSLSANGNVGQRNIQAVKEMLQALQIPLLAEHVGGKTGRTMIVDLKDFKTMVRLVHSQIVYI